MSLTKALNLSAYSKGGLQEIPFPCVIDLKKCSNFFFPLRLKIYLPVLSEYVYDSNVVYPFPICC